MKKKMMKNEFNIYKNYVKKFLIYKLKKNQNF